MKILKFNDLKGLSRLFYAQQLMLEHQTTKKRVVLTPTTHEEIIISSHAAPCLQIQCLPSTSPLLLARSKSCQRTSGTRLYKAGVSYKNIKLGDKVTTVGVVTQKPKKELKSLSTRIVPITQVAVFVGRKMLSMTPRTSSARSSTEVGTLCFGAVFPC